MLQTYKVEVSYTVDRDRVFADLVCTQSPENQDKYILLDSDDSSAQMCRIHSNNWENLEAMVQEELETARNKINERRGLQRTIPEDKVFIL